MIGKKSDSLDLVKEPFSEEDLFKKCPKCLFDPEEEIKKIRSELESADKNQIRRPSKMALDYGVTPHPDDPDATMEIIAVLCPRCGYVYLKLPADSLHKKGNNLNVVQIDSNTVIASNISQYCHIRSRTYPNPNLCVVRV